MFTWLQRSCWQQRRLVNSQHFCNVYFCWNCSVCSFHQVVCLCLDSRLEQKSLSLYERSKEVRVCRQGRSLSLLGDLFHTYLVSFTDSIDLKIHGGWPLIILGHLRPLWWDVWCKATQTFITWQVWGAVTSNYSFSLEIICLYELLSLKKNSKRGKDGRFSVLKRGSLLLPPLTSVLTSGSNYRWGRKCKPKSPFVPILSQAVWSLFLLWFVGQIFLLIVG